MSGLGLGLGLSKLTTSAPVGFSSLTGLQLFDHRGWPSVYPEHTMTAYGLSKANGAKYIECDVHVLSDGSLGVMHDTTVDRTTTSTGAPVTFTEAQWRAMVADCSTYLHANWDDDTPAMLSDVLDLYAGKIKLLLEPKSMATATALLSELNSRGVNKDQVMINSFSAGYLTAFRSAGYITYLNYVTYSGTPATEVDDGILINHLNNDPSVISDLQAEGLKASVYTINNYYQMRRFNSADSIWTDEGKYLRGTHRRSSDPFSDAIWYHGHIPCNSNGSYDGRGEFYGTDEWGVNAASSTSEWRGAVAGWANPLKGIDTTDGVSTVDDIEIEFELKFNSAATEDRLMWLHIGVNDNPMPTDANASGSGAAFDGSGYSFICRKNGGISIWRITNGEFDGPGTSPLVSTTSSAISNGGTANYKITVTPTNLKLERTDVAASCDVDNSTYRGGFLHYGCKGAFGTFRNINITE